MQNFLGKTVHRLLRVLLLFCLSFPAQLQALRFTRVSNENAEQTLAKTPALAPGFAAGTLVKTPQGHRPIETLAFGDLVATSSKGCHEEWRMVRRIRKFKTPAVAIVVVNNQLIVCGLSQRFFCRNLENWVIPNQFIWGCSDKSRETKLWSPIILQNNGIVADAKTYKVQETSILHQEVELYDITVEVNENYCITETNILVHNFVPVAIGAYITFGAGGIKFTGLTLGLSAAIGTAFFCWNRGEGLSKYRPEHSFIQELARKQEAAGAEVNFGFVPSDAALRKAIFGDARSNSGKNNPTSSPTNSTGGSPGMLPEDPDDDNKDPKHRDNVVKAKNMHEVFRETKTGEKLKQGSAEHDLASSRKADRTVYRLKETVKLDDGTKLKKGDRFYLDEQHKDHIEWFRGKHGKGVLNLDGTFNPDKSAKVLNRIFPGE